MDRINYTVQPQLSSFPQKTASNPSYVLYLPTVLLRSHQNPALKLAVELANHLNLPLIILIVLTTHHLPQSHPLAQNPPRHTARRLAFLLEALCPTIKAFQNKIHAHVFIKIFNPPQYQSMDHVTLSIRSKAVILDEPFVHPHLGFNEKIESVIKSCCKTNKEHLGCFRVDGSTTVPPRLLFGSKKLPPKAYQWQTMTESKRKNHLLAAQQGHFDVQNPVVHYCQNWEDASFVSQLPSTWRNSSLKSPEVRPWTLADFEWIWNHYSHDTTKKDSAKTSAQSPIPLWMERMKSISNNANYESKEKILFTGIDWSVPPCSQTIGTLYHGKQRWKTWMSQKGLVQYAKLRNNITLPHASSRMSCYLNLGIISIFDLVYEISQKLPHQNQRFTKYKTGVQKYEEEIVKWREFSYAHAFYHSSNYHHVTCVPLWAQNWLQSSYQQSLHKNNMTDLPSLDQLINGTTNDVTWNAMQLHLILTGELHNNARMTWGKTVVHWAAKGAPFVHEVLESSQNCRSVAEAVLFVLCYLNDRYALDGLSPPSYAGILWCLGWTEKAGKHGRISEKSASRYRYGPQDFETAKQVLLQKNLIRRDEDEDINGTKFSPNNIVKFLGTKRKDVLNNEKCSQNEHAHEDLKKKPKTKSIEAFFGVT